MSFLIIGLVFLSLLGSVMWVMPTKRDRFLAHIRLEATRLGFQVQLVKLAYPREKGEVEPRIVSSVAYRILRGKINQDDHQNWKSWRVVRCDANASEGLIQGWGWGLGERTLDKSTLESLNAMLSELPEYIKAIESTPIQLSAFWGETAESELKVIKQHLEKFITYKL